MQTSEMPPAASPQEGRETTNNGPIPRRRERWISLAGSLVVRLLVLTLRVRVEDPAALAARREGPPFILAFWHNRLLLVPSAWNRFFARHRRRQGMALSSTSRDGELIAQYIGRFGIGPVRGSATRRGSVALREMATLLKRGHDVAITPDGSRGPLYEIKPGLVLLAQLTGAPVLPISFEYSRAWRLRTWDRFVIPRPFSRVTLRVGEPVHIARTQDQEEFEVQRKRCEDAMRTLVRDDDLAR